MVIVIIKIIESFWYFSRVNVMTQRSAPSSGTYCNRPLVGGGGHEKRARDGGDAKATESLRTTT